MKMTMKRACLAASVAMVASAHAAVITFSGPVAATNTAVLDTEWLAGGTFVSGSTYGSGAKSFTTAGGQSIALNDGAGTFSNAGSQWSNDLMTTPTDVLEWTDALKGNLWHNSDDANPLTLHLSGLTVGQEYAVQLYSADARVSSAGREQAYWSSFSEGVFSGGTSGSFSQNPAYKVTGTFIADALTQNIYIQESGGSVGDDTTLAAYTLYAIPEPATIGLISVFGLGTLFVRRRLVM